MGNNIAIITGSSRGIGAALKTALEKRGDRVVGTSRKQTGDIREDTSIQRITALADESNVNVLVNCAGVYSQSSLVDENQDKIKEIIESNLIAPIRITAALWPVLKRNKGTVININSIAGRQFAGREVAYRASKFGMTGFSYAIACDGKADGIRVIDIPFSGVNTDMLKHRGSLKESYQQPPSAADLILRILDSKESFLIRHPLISGEIIDNQNFIMDK